jgi:restriction endonuclease S subunit
MGIKIFEINFSNLGSLFSIRSDVGFYNPLSEENKVINFVKTKYKTIKLRYLSKKTGQGPSIRILDSVPDGDVGLITIENIESFSIEVDPTRLHYVPRGIVKDSNLLKKGDILTPRVRGLGNITLIDENDKYIPSENVLFIRLKEGVLKKIILKFLAYYLATIGKKQILVLQTGGESGSINQTLLKEIIIPEVDFTTQENIIKEVKKIEDKIKSLKKEINPLQEVIENVFAKYGVKNTKFERKEFEAFTTDSSKIANQKFLRCGAQYRAFWDVHNGLLFEGNSKFPLVKLGSVMKLHKTKTLKKGVLDKEYILIELEDIEPGNGRVTSLDRVVTEIGSDKTYFGDCNLITTKLRPYLGYTILNNPESELIGTTELLPFKINKNLASHEYIKYLLLSYEYLEKSGFLMHGKEHPRIHPLDLLNIKIPLPKDLGTPQAIVVEIQEQEEINNAAQRKIKTLREEINKIIWTTLTEGGKSYGE